MGDGEALDPERARVLFRALLGRDVRPHEFRDHVASLPSVEALLDMILASDEYAARAAWHAEESLYANIWHPSLRT
jgi:hypothetical protein